MANALSRLYMGSVAHVEGKKGSSEGCSQAFSLGSRLMSISDSGATVPNAAESSFVVEVKKKQGSDLILLELKGAVHNQRVEVFS